MRRFEESMERELRAAEKPLVDDGFTEGVLRRLPSRRRRLEWSPRWTLAGAAAAGSFLTLVLTPPIETLWHWSGSIAGFAVPAPTLLVFIVFAAVPLVWLLRSD